MTDMSLTVAVASNVQLKNLSIINDLWRQVFKIFKISTKKMKTLKIYKKKKNQNEIQKTQRNIQQMEGEWRLGCPVEHHYQGVHSKKAAFEYLWEKGVGNINIARPTLFGTHKEENCSI